MLVCLNTLKPMKTDVLQPLNGKCLIFVNPLECLELIYNLVYRGKIIKKKQTQHIIVQISLSLDVHIFSRTILSNDFLRIHRVYLLPIT